METAKAVELELIPLLRQIGWASSNSEARRMLISGGLRIDGEVIEDDTIYFCGSEFIMSFGKRRWIRIIVECMKQFYSDDAREEWGKHHDV